MNVLFYFGKLALIKKSDYFLYNKKDVNLQSDFIIYGRKNNLFRGN